MVIFKNLIDETTHIKNEIIEFRNSLRDILISKNVEVSDNENRLPVLIDKIDLLDCTPSLYKKGNECDNITGGYSDKFDYDVSSTNNTNLVFNSDHVSISATGVNSSNNYRYAVTNKLIDLSSYSSIIIEYEILSVSSSGANLYLAVDNNQSYKDGRIASVFLNQVGNYKARLSIESLDVGYVYFGVITNGSLQYNISAKIYNVYLEK